MADSQFGYIIIWLSPGNVFYFLHGCHKPFESCLPYQPLLKAAIQLKLLLCLLYLTAFNFYHTIKNINFCYIRLLLKKLI
jgi:hypothetical protein